MNEIGASMESLQFEPSSACTVVVVYEDASAQRLALKLSDVLRAQFGGDVDFDFSWWNFRYLGSAEIAEAARRAASDADIILFSVHPGSELPLAVKEWVEAWLPEHLGQPGALALLVDPAASAEVWSSSANAYLGDVAKQGELDYLLLSETAHPGPLGGMQRQTEPILQARTATTRYPEVSSHWGINE